MRRLFLLFFLCILIIGAIFLLRLICFPVFNCRITPLALTAPMDKTQISGWVPWWKEDEAYSLIDTYSEEITSVSPVWFYLNDKYLLEESKGSSSVPREDIAGIFHENGLELIPTLGSELHHDQLTPFFDPDNNQMDILISKLKSRLVYYGADGLDVDLEGINKEDKENFTLFLEKLKVELSEDNLKLVVTVNALSGTPDDEYSPGQDLERIGQIADEVRVMIYDRHGTFSEAGAISPYAWMSRVINYNMAKIPHHKLVIGLPSYGYAWEAAGKVKSLQYDEFQNYLLEPANAGNYKVNRDPFSGELVYKSDQFTGWLSDHRSMLRKIKLARSYGLNRFVIWSLGGMDSRLFLSLKD